MMRQFEVFDVPFRGIRVLMLVNISEYHYMWGFRRFIKELPFVA